MPTDSQFIEKSAPPAYVGLVPAAGLGTRLPDRTSCKELVPVGHAERETRPVIDALLENLEVAGITQATVVLRKEKTDLSGHLRNRQQGSLEFTEVITAGTSGVPESVILGLEKIGDQNIAFGFPDILLRPRGSFKKLTHELDSSSYDVVLGLFPTGTPQKMDMVEIDDRGTVQRIDIKPATTTLKLSWVIAVWRPRFSHFLRTVWLDDTARMNPANGDIHLGHAFRYAMGSGLQIGSVSFPHGEALDVGTPDDLARAANWRG